MRGRDIETAVPGIKTAHSYITNRCLEVHGDEGAFDEAASIVRRLYRETLRSRKDRGNLEGVRFHLMLTTEAPPPGEFVLAANLRPDDLIWDLDNRKHAIVKTIDTKRLVVKAEPTGLTDGTVWTYPPGRQVILVERAGG